MEQVADCPLCGARAVGGRAGCQALFETVAARSYADVLYGRVYRLALDAYCMQHAEDYGQSARSYAAHLVGLCCGIERSGDAEIYRAIPHWLNGPKAVDKPALLTARGTVTVVDVPVDDTPEEHMQAVERWAQGVWAAYAGQHLLARRWLDEAVNAARMPRPH
jgi:hypothetical protein